jgi:hypothetical protein
MIDIRRFVVAFENAVNQVMVQKSNQLGKGQCKDMEEYKLRVGEIRGLDAAAGLARDMLRKYEMDEEDKEQGAGQ